jgi:beta-fructofuranosidase
MTKREVDGMYAGFGFRPSEIGDVEVVYHQGLFHLFHLVLPNHDYIAHAISRDGLDWTRVENALFISDPGAWDDDMLWTMSVSPDPHREQGWRMFYTGLTLSERGRIQRVGLARSPDLIRWAKETESHYPLQLQGPPYEHSLDQGRNWVSFRDPYFIQVDGTGYLLAAARVDQGPVIRRGCVALLEEVDRDRFEPRDPLFFPNRYDDVEVPVPVEIEDRWYLLGSIREDVKVHYWHSSAFHGPYVNFTDNVLLPEGNYAARVCHDGDRWLVWNFFFRGRVSDGNHLLPPPKELQVDENGELYLTSFHGFDARVREAADGPVLLPLKALFGRDTGWHKVEEGVARFGCQSGFEIFLLPGQHRDFRLSGELQMDGGGKIGLVFRLTPEGDGYYLSLDLKKGLAQLRSWGTQVGGTGEGAFRYKPLQASFYEAHEGPHSFGLISYGAYLEFSLDHRVLLTLADQDFQEGRVGFYTESAALRIGELRLDTLSAGEEELYVPHRSGGSLK